MIGLIANRPSSAASSSMDEDQSSHSSSSVSTSTSTCETTSVTRSVLVATRQRHQPIGGHAGNRFRPAAHVREQPLPPGLRAALLADAHTVGHDVELDLAVRQQAQPLANVLRNRDLALGGNAHGITPTSNTDMTTTRRQRNTARAPADAVSGVGGSGVGASSGSRDQQRVRESLLTPLLTPGR